jgi:diguanylate cyclase (GGDEF)-like protein/PAS domain S-box-containing protein
VVLDAEGRVIESNKVATHLLGQPGAVFEGLSSLVPRWNPVHEDGSWFTNEENPVLMTLQTGKQCIDVVVGVDVPGEAQLWLTVDTHPINSKGKLQGVIAIFNDISSQIMERRLLRLLTEVNRVVMVATDEADSLQQLCRAIVEEGAYALAWIGVTSNDVEGDIDIVCAVGEVDYLYDGIVSWSASKETGLGPVGTALRKGVTQVVNDLPNDSLFQPWRDRASRFKLNSCIAIPFSPGTKRAVLAIYDRHIMAFDDSTVRQFDDIAKEVEFSVAHVHSVQKTEATLERAVAAVSAMNAAEVRFRLAFEDNMAPMVLTDLEDRVIDVNDAFCEMLGRTKLEVLGHDSTLLTFPEDIGISEEAHRRLTSGEFEQIRYVKRYLHKDGRAVVVEVSKSPARDPDGHALYFVISERDITEEQALKTQLLHQAFYDTLTGLANRALFDDRLRQAHEQVIRRGALGAVLFLDLDNFKAVNDAYGHVVGDELLTSIARRLEHVTRTSDTLCRFGGDQFLYLTVGVRSVEEAEEVARRLLDALIEPFPIAGSLLQLPASVGVVVWDKSSSGPAEIIQQADVALYEAKRRGPGHHTVFTPSMQQEAVSRFTLVQELRRALQGNEISMHYQPIVDLASNVIVGFEALMRWQHPERGWIAPGEFIPIAENSDLIFDLGSFALSEAVAAASTWTSPNGRFEKPYVTVNASARQFHDPRLVKVVEETLAAGGLESGRLIIEITESIALLDAAETLGTIEDLNHLGVGIALDDFGTGFSSLSYLASINPRIIKIDQSFVSPSAASAKNDMLLETIISLGNKLNMTMLAEGVETRGQLERLHQLGCKLGQGYLFSPAVPADAVAALLDRTANDWE